MGFNSGFKRLISTWDVNVSLETRTKVEVAELNSESDVQAALPSVCACDSKPHSNTVVCSRIDEFSFPIMRQYTNNCTQHAMENKRKFNTSYMFRPGWLNIWKNI